MKSIALRTEALDNLAPGVAGNPQEVVLDRPRKHATKLEPATLLEIRALYRRGVPLRTIAGWVGLSRPVLERALAWAFLDGLAPKERNSNGDG